MKVFTTAEKGQKRERCVGDKNREIKREKEMIKIRNTERVWLQYEKNQSIIRSICRGTHSLIHPKDVNREGSSRQTFMQVPVPSEIPPTRNVHSRILCSSQIISWASPRPPPPVIVSYRISTVGRVAIFAGCYMPVQQLVFTD